MMQIIVQQALGLPSPSQVQTLPLRKCNPFASVIPSPHSPTRHPILSRSRTLQVMCFSVSWGEDIVVMKEAPVRIRAPKVELLGEVVFGEVRNQPQNCSMKSVMRNDVDESSSSISDLRTAKGHREHTTSSHLQVSPFKVSATSHRSFTVEETGGSGSNMSTPVRRSSRIHNRGVTSSRIASDFKVG